MSIYYQDERVTLYGGDALAVLASLPDTSVDAVVTDPPYGLEFMGREWDSFAPQNTTAQRSNAGGFGAEDGKPWNKARSGTKGVRSTFRCRSCQGWSGAFSEARAKRQKACACETPDFDYAGAPAQTIAFGKWCELWTAECLRVLKPGGMMLSFGGTRTWHRLTCAVEDAGFEVRDSIAWLYGSGLSKGGLLGNRPGLEWCECESLDDGALRGRPDCPRCGGLDPAFRGFSTTLKPAFEPVVVARKPLTGTVAANVLAHGTGALNIDATRIRAGGQLQWAAPRDGGTDSGPAEAQANDRGRWPANVVLNEDQVEALDRQSGETSYNPAGTFGTQKGNSADSGDVPYSSRKEGDGIFGYGDRGGASRFFYVAKADAAERPRVNGVAHPTVKPLDLMRWLVRLVTPPGGTVLEPFAGSGTTVEACIIEGFRCIAIEREADYLPLITQRIHRRLDPLEAVRQAGGDLGLFDFGEPA